MQSPTESLTITSFASISWTRSLPCSLLEDSQSPVCSESVWAPSWLLLACQGLQLQLLPEHAAWCGQGLPERKESLTKAHHIHLTCIVPIVFSKASFKSPPVLASQAVLKAVNKSPVPTKAAANFGMRTCKTGRVESSTYKLDQPLLQFSCHPWHGWPAPPGGCRYPALCWTGSLWTLPCCE